MFKTPLHDQAIGDLSEALRLNPAYAEAYHRRGLAWAGKKEFGKALADLNEAIRLDPKFVRAHISRAGLLATCAEPKYRDPKQAIESAKTACELTAWKDASGLNTLAIAYAAQGDFASASRFQSRSSELVARGGNQGDGPRRD